MKVSVEVPVGVLVEVLTGTIVEAVGVTLPPEDVAPLGRPLTVIATGFAKPFCDVTRTVYGAMPPDMTDHVAVSHAIVTPGPLFIVMGMSNDPPNVPSERTPRAGPSFFAIAKVSV